MSRRRLRIYLRSARKAAGLSQAELGALLGYSEAAVSKCENEARPPTFKFAIGCAYLFGKSIAELFPSATGSVQDVVGLNAAKLDEELRGRTDAESRKKLVVLSAMAQRATPLDP